jgi:hypothetical protein
MPKVDIDYTNTLFYKISCKDTNITDVYIGHTTNFVQRKSGHKQGCNNAKSSNYACKLYTVIRQNGGWDNWRMDIIAYHECKDHYEARKKEQEYFILYNATLNSIEPMPRPKCVNTPTTPIKRNNIRSKQLFENCKFECKNCNYTTIRHSQYTRHITTAKHIRMTTNDKTVLNSSIHICDCGKEYKYRQGLFSHRKKCDASFQNQLTVTFPPTVDTLPPIDSALVIELLKQNQEFKELLAEQNKHMIEQQQQLIDAVNRLR